MSHDICDMTCIFYELQENRTLALQHATLWSDVLVWPEGKATAFWRFLDHAVDSIHTDLMPREIGWCMTRGTLVLLEA